MRNSRRQRRGYICIWGTSHREKVTDSEGVTIECPGCGQTSRMVGKSMRPYCSVFYIPLFPQGQGESFIECTRCGGKYNGNAASIRARQADQKAKMEAAIVQKMSLYQANPANAELGCELVELLAESDRIDEAMKFALCLTNSSPQHAGTHFLLGRLHLHRKELDQAIQAFRRAIDRNPAHAGAHFYAAVALMNAGPSRLGEALASARKAGECGHPEARNLAQAIEQAQQR